jgi:protein O-GlcNAc transferase
MLLRYKVLIMLIAVLPLVGSCQSKQQTKKEAAARWNKVSARIKVPVAQQQFDNGKYSDAAKTIGECLKGDPNLPQAHLLAGKILFVQGQGEASIKEFEKAVALDEKLDDGWYWLGFSCEEKKQIAAAMEYYQKALNLNGTNIEYILALVRAYTSINKYDEALALIQEKMAVLPAEFELKVKCADLLSRKQKYDQAIWLYKQAVLLAPDRHDIAESLGYCCIIAGKWADASEVFTNLVDSCTDENKKAVYLQLLGTCQLNAAQYGGAINTFSRLTPKDRDNPQVWIQMGQAALGVGDADRAYDCSKRALAIQPNNPQAISLKGSAEYLRKNYNDAIKCFGQIANLPQHTSFAKMMLTKCYQHSGNKNSNEIVRQAENDNMVAN